MLTIALSDLFSVTADWASLVALSFVVMTVTSGYCKVRNSRKLAKRQYR